jgi:Ca-activated chloride channel family protein
MNFAEPGWLILLILLPLLGAVALFTSRMRKERWKDFVAPRLRGALLVRAKSLPRWLALFLLLAACAATIVALARPQGNAGTRTEKTIGRNVMIALDISRSMRVNDVKPDRLTQTKVVIYELIDSMPNERIGLIGFAGNPYVYAPLTVDHSAVREIVDQIDETWAPLGGSDLTAAIHLAIDTLKKTGQKNNALVILSDGEKHEGEIESIISDAAEAGVFIIAIGVGTPDGGFVPHRDYPNGQLVDRSGRPVISRLQTEVLQKLAKGTNGRFTVIGSGADIPAMVKSVVKDLDAFQMEGREQRVSVEFYQWLLFPAILLLASSIIAATRWKGVRGVVAAALASLCLTPHDIQASEASEAKKALLANRHDEAMKAYQKLAEKSRAENPRARYRLGEAIAAYRKNDFRAARSAYSQSILTDDAELKATGHLGIGNSLFQLGWKSLSGESYPTDQGSLPDLDRFDTLVKEALAKLRGTAAPEDGDAAGFSRIEKLITNWADAVRHYDSSLALFPDQPAASGNRILTITYLKRLQDLLEKEKQDTEESMPQPQPGEGQPQQGEGESEPQEDGENPQDGKPPSEKGKGGEDPKEGDNGEDQPKEGDKNDESKDGDSEQGDPNETKEERAKRILKDNADLEKGPLSPGRREFRDAMKDW